MSHKLAIFHCTHSYPGIQSYLQCFDTLRAPRHSQLLFSHKTRYFHAREKTFATKTCFAFIYVSAGSVKFVLEITGLAKAFKRALFESSVFFSRSFYECCLELSCIRTYSAILTLVTLTFVNIVAKYAETTI